MEFEFFLSNCSDVQTKNKWNVLKEYCEYGNNEDIVNEWIQFCIMDNNKNATFMNTLDGGIILQDKNIVRFRYCLSGLQTDDSIILNYIIVDDILTCVDEIMNSTKDLLSGFIKMANSRLGKECVKGKINIYKNIV